MSGDDPARFRQVIAQLELSNEDRAHVWCAVFAARLSAYQQFAGRGKYDTWAKQAIEDADAAIAALARIEK